MTEDANRDITFFRLRPASAVTEVTASTRRAEGTTAMELDRPDPESVAACLAGGTLPIAVRFVGEGVMGWVVEPKQALELSGDGIPGWRLSVVHSTDRAAVVDALARTEAAFLRTGRSRVAEAAGICGLPSIGARVSVFVDSVTDALAVIDSGADDLLLRDWDSERIGQLRDAVAGHLVERVAAPGGVSVDEARQSLSAKLFKAYLDLVDAGGYARPRYSWAPGVPAGPPLNPHRISAAWPDALWTTGSSMNMAGASRPVRAIIDASLEGRPPTVKETATLLSSRGNDVDAITAAADALRKERVGDTVTYVVNRNINYTNICYFRCGFCAFSKGPRSLNLRGDPYLMSVEEVVNRTTEAAARGRYGSLPPGRNPSPFHRPVLCGCALVDQGSGSRDARARLHATRGMAGRRDARDDSQIVPGDAQGRRPRHASRDRRRDSRRPGPEAPVPGQDPDRAVGRGDAHRS